MEVIVKRLTLSTSILLALLFIHVNVADGASRGSRQSAAGGVANVRFVELDTDARTARLRNFGGASLNIANHWRNIGEGWSFIL